MVMAPVEIETSLKAICPRKDLFAAVQIVGHAVTGRSSLPILGHILIQSEGNSLRLLATDLELGISCRLPAHIEEAGSLTAPSKTIAEVLANLPDKSEVALSVDRSYTTRIHCEKSDYKILGLRPEEYPRLPEVKDTTWFKISQSVLKEMIRQTLFAVSLDDGRAVLTGIYMEFQETTLRFVATDTHRLAVKDTTLTEGVGTQNAIIPARAMNELTRLLSDTAGDVTVTLSPTQIRFDMPGEDQIQIISRLIEGQYPNYSRVVPSESSRTIKTNTAPLLSAVRRASIVAKDATNANRVVLRTEENSSLILTAENQMVGSAFEELEASCEGDPIQIAFNAKYLMDVLSVFEEESITIELTEPLRPGVLKPVIPPKQENDIPSNKPAGKYLCVLMPMQLA